MHFTWFYFDIRFLIMFLNPFNQVGGGGGGLPFTQNIIRQPIPEKFDLANVLLWMPLWKNMKKKNSFTPSQSTWKYGSENRPWGRGLI